MFQSFSAFYTFLLRMKCRHGCGRSILRVKASTINRMTVRSDDATKAQAEKSPDATRPAKGKERDEPSASPEPRRLGIGRLARPYRHGRAPTQSPSRPSRSRGSNPEHPLTGDCSGKNLRPARAPPFGRERTRPAFIVVTPTTRVPKDPGRCKCGKDIAHPSRTVDGVGGKIDGANSRSVPSKGRTADARPRL